MASAYVFIDPGVGFPGISNTGTFNSSSGPPAPLAFGLIAGARDPTYGYAEFMFVQGSTNAAGDLCLVQGGTTAVCVSRVEGSAQTQVRLVFKNGLYICHCENSSSCPTSCHDQYPACE